MAKGSVRKKGKKWYARFYIEDESGRKVQKEFVGTESKSETEALLRKAIADYEEKKFVAKSENITVGMLLDLWVEEELKPGNLSNGTVMAYMGTVNRIKKYPIGDRKLKIKVLNNGQIVDNMGDLALPPRMAAFSLSERGSARMCRSSVCGSVHGLSVPNRIRSALNVRIRRTNASSESH